MHQEGGRNPSPLLLIQPWVPGLGQREHDFHHQSHDRGLNTGVGSTQVSAGWSQPTSRLMCSDKPASLLHSSSHPCPSPSTPHLYTHLVTGQVHQSSIGMEYRDPGIRLEENEIFKGIWSLKSCEQRGPKLGCDTLQRSRGLGEQICLQGCHPCSPSWLSRQSPPLLKAAFKSFTFLMVGVVGVFSC